MSLHLDFIFMNTLQTSAILILFNVESHKSHIQLIIRISTKSHFAYYQNFNQLSNLRVSVKLQVNSHRQSQIKTSINILCFSNQNRHHHHQKTDRKDQTSVHKDSNRCHPSCTPHLLQISNQPLRNHLSNLSSPLFLTQVSPFQTPCLSNLQQTHRTSIQPISFRLLSLGLKSTIQLF